MPYFKWPNKRLFYLALDFVVYFLVSLFISFLYQTVFSMQLHVYITRSFYFSGLIILDCYTSGLPLTGLFSRRALQRDSTQPESTQNTQGCWNERPNTPYSLHYEYRQSGYWTLPLQNRFQSFFLNPFSSGIKTQSLGTQRWDRRGNEQRRGEKEGIHFTIKEREDAT